MTHTVVWAESAAEELAAIWLAASDRDVVTAAARDVDEMLRTMPAEAGESRSHGRRILIGGPIAVTFEIRAADRLVKVLDAWRSDS